MRLWSKCMHDVKFSPTEEVVLNLIYTDMKFIYNLIQDIEKQESANFAISLLPYMALVYKEAYKWCYKNKKIRKYLPEIPKKIEDYYEYYREYNKLLKEPISVINEKYKAEFHNAKNHFSNKRKFLKYINIYNIYGVGTFNNDLIKLSPIYNTVYFSVIIPGFSWDNFDQTAKEAYKLSYHLGYFFGLFLDPHLDRLTDSIDNNKIEDYDFGARTSPFHKVYRDEFLIFDLLCKCNFLLYGLNNYTTIFKTTKLRFTYNLYFYICENLDKINSYYNTNFTINTKYKDNELRSAFMHYGIWKIVKDKFNPLDSFGGMTNIRLGIDWNNLLIFTLSEIKSFSLQLDNYLSKNNLSHNYSIFNKA